MLHKKLGFAFAPLLAVVVFAAAPAAASAAEWFANGVKVGGFPGAPVTTHSPKLTLKAGGTTVNCEVNDSGWVWNEGVGKDVILKFENTKCTSNIPGCEAEPALKVAVGTPMGSELFVDAAGKIRDLIRGVEVTVSCGGAPVAFFEGKLTPLISEVNGTATFDAGSGELHGQVGTEPATATVEGEDALEGPPGEEIITVK